MPVQQPQEMHRAFESAFNAADVDALLSLYEPGAAFEPEPGQQVAGLDGIREALGGFLALKGKISVETTKVVEAGDLALTHGRWSLEGTAPDGSAVNLSGETTEVLRRQPDGSWLHAIDLPNDV